MKKIEELDAYLNKQRNEWTYKISELSSDLKKGDKLEEVSSYVLSYRQILVEQLATLSIKIRSQKTVVDKKYKDKWLSYYNYDYKLTDKQKEKFIDADIADDKQVYEILEAQKSFIEGSVKTLDNFSFAIRNRLDISKL